MRRYNQIIGFATRDDRAPASTCTCTTSAWCRARQLRSRDYAFGADVQPTPAVAQPATFMGIVRADGRVATRNYIGDPLDGELLGDGRARDRRSLPRRLASEALPLSERRRRRRADARHRLRHGRWARASTCCGGRSPAMRGTRTSRRCSSSASAARPTRSRRSLRRRESAGERAPARATTCRTSAAPRRRSRAASRACKRDAAARQQRRSASRCRRAT